VNVEAGFKVYKVHDIMRVMMIFIG